MTKADRQFYLGLATFIIFIIVILAAAALWDKSSATKQSLVDRVSLLEEKMIERVKPVIQINRATIYNTEGEIVVEVLEDRK